MDNKYNMKPGERYGLQNILWSEAKCMDNKT